MVVPYDPTWAAMFDEEVQRVSPTFGDTLLLIEHIGSTAVPGLASKPPIDLLAVVRDIRTVDALTTDIAAQGYEPRGDLGIAGRRLFTKWNFFTPTHNLHCYQQGDPEIADRVNFSAYLRMHPQRAAEYGALKEELAQQFPRDISAYVRGKTSFVHETLRLAASEALCGDR